MELVTPGIGLLFWMLVSFLSVFFILKKYAWKPILNALKEREESIDEALKSADTAKAEMKKFQADNELILQKAREEKAQMLHDAKEIKKQIINDAKSEAAEEGRKMIENARSVIETEKATALNEIKKQVAELSVSIAEKILQKELEDQKAQNEMVDKMLSDIKLK